MSKMFIKEPTKQNPIEIIYKKQALNPLRPNHLEMCDVIEENRGKGTIKLSKNRQKVVIGSTPINY